MNMKVVTECACGKKEIDFVNFESDFICTGNKICPACGKTARITIHELDDDYDRGRCVEVGSKKVLVVKCGCGNLEVFAIEEGEKFVESEHICTKCNVTLENIALEQLLKDAEHMNTVPCDDLFKRCATEACAIAEREKIAAIDKMWKECDEFIDDSVDTFLAFISRYDYTATEIAVKACEYRNMLTVITFGRG